MVTLTWIVDDVAAPPFATEHGFSLWIEVNGRRVLFDTGGSGEVLLHNLALLELDPATLDAVVLSHGHDDHTGGLPGLLPHLKRGAPLYGHPSLFEARYSGPVTGPAQRSLALTAADLAHDLTVRLDDQPVEVVPGVWTTGEIRTREAPEGRSARHFVQRDGAYVPDPYIDDLSLVVETGTDRVMVLCGCCHAGLLNTLATVRHLWPAKEIVGIVGGVHLVNAPADVIQSTTSQLLAMPHLAYLWLGHCSGREFIDYVAQVLSSEPDMRLWRRTAGHTMVVASEGVQCD